MAAGSAYRYIDIGINPGGSFAGWERETERAAAQGIGVFLTGADLAGSRENLAAARRLTARGVPCWATAGVHPHVARDYTPATTAALRALQTDPLCVAAGECGLDFDRMFSPQADQLRAFRAQLALAEETGRPLFLHERAAAAEFTAVLKEYPRLCQRAVVHCFTDGPAEIAQFLALGCSIGITGWICDDRRAGPLRDAVRQLPLDRLLLETDSPYLGQPGWGRPNSPCNVIRVADGVARFTGRPAAEVAAAARANTARLFGI